MLWLVLRVKRSIHARKHPNSWARYRAAPKQDVPLLCQPSKTLRAGSEPASSLIHHPSNARRHFSLKTRIEPDRIVVMFADGERGLTCCCAVRLRRANMQRVADDVALGSFERQPRQLFRIARQKRRERSEGVDARFAQAVNHLNALMDGRAMRLVLLAHFFPRSSNRKAHLRAR